MAWYSKDPRNSHLWIHVNCERMTMDINVMSSGTLRRLKNDR